MNFKTDHEVRGIPKIVSEGRPQRCARRNRIARATMADSKADNVAAVRDAAESTEAVNVRRLGNGLLRISTNGSATTRRETVEVLPVRRMLADASARYMTAVVAHAALAGRAACDGFGPVFAELGGDSAYFLDLQLSRCRNRPFCRLKRGALRGGRRDGETCNS